MTRRIPRVLTSSQVRQLVSCQRCGAARFCPCCSTITGEVMGGVHPLRHTDAQEMARKPGTHLPQTHMVAWRLAIPKGGTRR